MRAPGSVSQGPNDYGRPRTRDRPRREPEAPRTIKSGRLSEAVDAAVLRADHEVPGGNGRRGGDRLAGVEFPPLFTRRGVEPVQLAVARTHVHASARND